nr:MAG TPA: hypothetical protein [Podoviridae sp. ctgx11]
MLLRIIVSLRQHNARCDVHHNLFHDAKVCLQKVICK